MLSLFNIANVIFYLLEFRFILSEINNNLIKFTQILFSYLAEIWIIDRDIFLII